MWWASLRQYNRTQKPCSIRYPVAHLAPRQPLSLPSFHGCVWTYKITVNGKRQDSVSWSRLPLRQGVPYSQHFLFLTRKWCLQLTFLFWNGQVFTGTSLTFPWSTLLRISHPCSAASIKICLPELINETQNRNTIKKINETKSCFFKTINKIDKL